MSECDSSQGSVKGESDGTVKLKPGQIPQSKLDLLRSIGVPDYISIAVPESRIRADLARQAAEKAAYKNRWKWMDENGKQIHPGVYQLPKHASSVKEGIFSLYCGRHFPIPDTTDGVLHPEEMKYYLKRIPRPKVAKVAPKLRPSLKLAFRGLKIGPKTKQPKVVLMGSGSENKTAKTNQAVKMENQMKVLMENQPTPIKPLKWRTR